MKLQVTLPNGILGSGCIGPMHIIDTSLMETNGIDTYPSKLFRDFRMQLSGASN